MFDCELLAKDRFYSGEEDALSKVGHGVDIDGSVEDRRRVAEHVGRCEGDGGQGGPAEGVVAGAVDAGAFVWNVDSGRAFHEPWWLLVLSQSTSTS